MQEINENLDKIMKDNLSNKKRAGLSSTSIRLHASVQDKRANNKKI
ncbi:MAG TPA: hypothetical protein VFK40_07625 [Nitrososphaeraceae archaeon]|nr:hypothetical protein [Nitrososphaeraceae archaeon]